jgi:hypothetical protein
MTNSSTCSTAYTCESGGSFATSRLQDLTAGPRSEQCRILSSGHGFVNTFSGGQATPRTGSWSAAYILK